MELMHQRVTAKHLQRTAYLYVRQSSLQQVIEHTEGRQRQYQLRERALQLGWPEEQIVTIDSDQGQSGATADRAGFQHLVAEVGLGHAGIVMGLEVSRLARNSTDWHRLLEICAITETLILDEEGLYDPQHFNDRLLLGLKGTMSEAELHMIRARLQGAILTKARRGELRTPLPIGFAYDDEGAVVLDPDQQIRETIHTFFRTFRRVGSALGTVKEFRRQGIAFPRYKGQGAWIRQGLAWGTLDFASALRLLKNPRYAGVYFFGASRQRRLPNGRWLKEQKPPEQWTAFLPQAHEAYITLADYEENQRRLAENARAIGADHRRTPAREGPALVQGLAICGRCGRRMTLSYHRRAGGLVPTYFCWTKPGSRCQSIHGAAIDEAVGQLLLETVAPVTLEVSLNVQREIEQRLAEAHRLREQKVQRARYEAEQARLRFLHVDPAHRLVAATLEAEWNEKLKALAAAQDELERRQQEDRRTLTAEQRAKLLALASDLPRLWNDPQTPARERKRMLRLLVEDVTLLSDNEVHIHVRFYGGATSSLTLPLPKRLWEVRKTDSQVLAEIDALLDELCEDEVAQCLNERGLRTATGLCFNATTVGDLRRKYRLRSRNQRLREAGFKPLTKIAADLHVGLQKLHDWRANGLLQLKPHRVVGQRYLYEVPADWPQRTTPSRSAETSRTKS
jgi:DNA invertase Pin-like site-specific DNA recombinase